METEAQKTTAAPPAAAPSISKLFRVLVLGGTLVAAALATAHLAGAIGAAESDGGADGGVQGW